MYLGVVLVQPDLLVASAGEARVAAVVHSVLLVLVLHFRSDAADFVEDRRSDQSCAASRPAVASRETPRGGAATTNLAPKPHDGKIRRGPASQDSS